MSIDLIRALQDAALYDHPVRQFQLVETHISWVLLTGDYAYKIKKPVDFGFLDFSSLEKRQFFCQQELDLNRRLAPELYLQVRTISGSSSAPVWDGAGPVLEYAVQMRQFDQAQRLDRLQERGELTADLLDRLMQRLASFYNRVPRANATSSYGRPETLQQAVLQNFVQIRPRLTDAADLAQLEMLQDWAERQYADLRNHLEQRQREGFVRECHGDLHLGNLVRWDASVLPFDCLEFNDRLRWVDVLNDLAFLLMDLEFRNEHLLSQRLLNQYLEQSGDYGGLRVLRFYQAYRAMVRAKVALLSGDNLQNPAEQQRCLALYRRYATLAESYSRIPRRGLLITQGVSGSGKSWLSERLAERLGLVRLRSDVERKRLQDSAAAAAISADGQRDLYSPEWTHLTYRHLAELATRSLASGYTPIVDATFLDEAQRREFRKLAKSLGVPFLIMRCEAPAEVLRERVSQRARSGQDPSDADLLVLEQQLRRQTPLAADELPYQLSLDTSRPFKWEELVNVVAARLHGAQAV